ncbi:FAD/NAD(P)-binding protein [Holzapfeliella sp. He02]|uniref:FAD/NAD(P)-binding protein n=1 Tax=Holzapfeliella saturejae TaxID=3082953 RepID=A0ABU8SH27_9LACO
MKIAIVGAGPRGISTLDQLNLTSHRFASKSLDIIVFDSFDIGGSVWIDKQNPLLIMNTPCGQATLFSENTSNTPSFFDWIKSTHSSLAIKNSALSNTHTDILLKEITHLTPTDYASRSLFGVYINWAFHQLVDLLAKKDISVNFINQEVTRVTPIDFHQFEVQTSSFTDTFSAVFMATGFPLNTLTQSESRLTEFATENDLTYIPAKNPSLANLDTIKPNETVILRGLGLTFYDYVTLLTQDRGGHFSKTDSGRYIYHKSGQEPIMYGFSRRGYPSHAKGNYEKDLNESMTPQFLTLSYLKTLSPHTLSYKSFINRVIKDLAYIYYSKSFPELDKADLLAQLTNGHLDDNLKRKLLPDNDFDFSRLMQPESEVKPKDLDDFTTTIGNFLLSDATQALEGNQTSPLATTLEMIRDLRQSIRFIIEHNLFEPADYVNQFLGSFKSLNNFLAAGPAVTRLLELEALVKAGIVHFIAPPVQFKTFDNQFMIQNHWHSIKATTLIESRLPKESVLSAHDSVYQQLLEDTIKPHTLGENNLQTGAVAVDRKTNQVIDQKDELIENLFIWGLPTEGLHFQTTTVAQTTPHNFFLNESREMIKALITNINY